LLFIIFITYMSDIIKNSFYQSRLHDFSMSNF